jgi:hypothetical protein
MESSFKNVVKTDYEEFLNVGYCKDAVELNKQIGEDYFDIYNPHYFTGDLASELVMIQLNPKRDKSDIVNTPIYKTFEKYWEHFTKFGEKNYNINTIYSSKFDEKQLRFLRKLDVLPFVDEKNKTDKKNNLALSIDKKLQIELIPFGSSDFDFRKITDLTIIRKYFERTISLLSEIEREYVLFCGAVFRDTDILKEFMKVKKEHKFRLMKKDGSLTKTEFELINILINYDNKSVKAAILPQFALQGAPVDKYAEKVKELYNIR